MEDIFTCMQYFLHNRINEILLFSSCNNFIVYINEWTWFFLIDHRQLLAAKQTEYKLYN